MFYNILTGYRRKEENQLKSSWEQTRRIMHTVLLPHQKTNKQGKVVKEIKLTDIMVFPWEEKPKERKKVSKKDAEAFWGKVDKNKTAL